jgi:hypothetical protein
VNQYEWQNFWFCYNKLLSLWAPRKVTEYGIIKTGTHHLELKQGLSLSEE